MSNVNPCTLAAVWAVRTGPIQKREIASIWRIPQNLLGSVNGDRLAETLIVK